MTSPKTALHAVLEVAESCPPPSASDALAWMTLIGMARAELQQIIGALHLLSHVEAEALQRAHDAAAQCDAQSRAKMH
jgi:hypothetical protein